MHGSTVGASRRNAVRLDLESFGVPYAIETDSLACARRLDQYLVPGSAPSPYRSESTFAVRVAPGRRTFTLSGPGCESSDSSLADALRALSAELRLHVAAAAEPWVFVHAGVVAWKRRIIVIPGSSFTGKSRLVRALLRLGATYYSDEFAVLDRDGLVHPFPKPLSIRHGEARYGTLQTAQSLGAAVGMEPLRIGLVVLVQYRRGAHWQPQILPRSAQIFALLHNTVAARLRPQGTLDALTRSVAGARGLRGPRGEAMSTARAILDAVEVEETLT